VVCGLIFGQSKSKLFLPNAGLYPKNSF